jgi:RNA polymerase sigma-70 factor (ECF subfamily)
MEKYVLIIAVGAIILAYLGFHLFTDVSIDTLPPVVIHTEPVSGQLNVDPSISEIQIRFSKNMMPENMYSLVRLTGSTFPEITGDVYFLEDERTCIIPVKLESGRTYAFWINKGHWNSFRDAGNIPAVPYLLVFRTRN